MTCATTRFRALASISGISRKIIEVALAPAEFGDEAPDSTSTRQIWMRVSLRLARPTFSTIARYAWFLSSHLAPRGLVALRAWMRQVAEQRRLCVPALNGRTGGSSRCWNARE